MFIYSFFIPLILATLSGMGIGGGGLFVIYMKLFGDIEQIHMQAINLVFFIFAAASALLVHLSYRKIYGRAVAVMAIFGIAGSLIGSAIAIRIDGDLLGKIFGFMLIGAGVYSFFRALKGKKRRGEQDATNIARKL